MSKSKTRVFIFILILVLSSSLVFASDASELYQSFSQAVESGDLEGAMGYYDDLSDNLAKEKEDGAQMLEKAFRQGNDVMYYTALGNLRELDQYKISKEQSDKLLSLIVNEEDEKQLEDAKWLYENSAFYSPRLTFSYTSSGDGYNYRYTRAISSCPGNSVILPDEGTMRINNSVLGSLVGWGILPDKIDYQPGETIEMPLVDQVLYAVYNSEVSFKDEITGLEDVISDTSSGDVIAVPSVSDVPEGYYFSGWYDNGTGEYLPKDVTEYRVKGNGASFEALYKALDVSNISAGPYTTLRTQSQHELTFDVTSIGNEDVSSITVKVESGNDDVKFITDSAYIRDLPAKRACRISSLRFVVDADYESGTQIPFTVTLEDGNGAVWTKDFTFSIR